PVGTLAASLPRQAATAAVPPAVFSSTIKAATLFAAGQATAAGAASAPAVALLEGVLKAMLLAKLRGVLLLLLAVLLAVGAALVTYGVVQAGPGGGNASRTGLAEAPELTAAEESEPRARSTGQ